MPCSCWCRGSYWRRDHDEVSTSYPGRSVGSRGSVGRRPMAQQKSEDRVVLEGGVMPAEPASSSVRGRGKAVPVDQTVLQLELLIATAENPRGAARPASSDLSEGRGLAGVPKAIGKAENGTPVTMEEVADRLTLALLKVVSNGGAPGPDGQTIEELREQWPVACPKLRADLSPAFGISARRITPCLDLLAHRWA